LFPTTPLDRVEHGAWHESHQLAPNDLAPDGQQLRDLVVHDRRPDHQRIDQVATHLRVLTGAKGEA